MTKNDKSALRASRKRAAWTRWLDLALRSAHVVVTSVLMGAAVFAVPYPQTKGWAVWATVTGCGLIASEVYHRPWWFCQGRGVMVLIHVGLVGLIHLRPDWQAPILAAVIAVGMVGSHMPKRYRYWSFVHRRVMD